MPSDLTEPSGGAKPPHERSDDSLAPGAPVSPAGLSSTSGDDLSISLTEAPPDPLLGAFDAQVEADPTNSPRADALNALSALHVDSADKEVALLGGGLSVTSSDALANLNLNAPPIPTPRIERNHSDETIASDDGEEDDEPARVVSLGTLLLASYASAVTLGLVWVLWTGRRVREDVSEFVPIADSRTDPGERAVNSRRMAAPKPIPAEHSTVIGKTIRLGLIEATPLAITSGPIELERDFNGRETKPGGEKALKLRLRLKNVSTDVILAPFDEAFVRERINADPDSFIELGSSGETIAMYPLAVESEWSIVGQSFRELKPGEAFETQVVAAPDAADKAASPMTWRVRLRTDINHTDDLGVRFRPDNVKPGP